MPTGFYLLDHPNPHGDHFHRSRRGSILAVLVHITAGLEDLDGHDDHSAEKTAAYAAGTDRAVSWHSGSDTDSALDLLPWSFTAFHVQGYNSRTVGHEISKTSPDWRGTDPAWIERTLRRAAEHLAPRMAAFGIPIRKATKAELDRAIAGNGNPVGLIGHFELDDDRRQDPGQVGSLDTFPWGRFLELLTEAMEGDDMALTPKEKDEIGTIAAMKTVAVLKPELDEISNALAGYATVDGKRADGIAAPKKRSALGELLHKSGIPR